MGRTRKVKRSPFASRDARIAELEKKNGHRPIIHFERDGGRSCYIVWANWDPGDYYYMVPSDQFDPHVLHFMRKHPNLFVEGLPED